LPPESPRFLLDENFSHRLGERLPMFGYDVQQVQRVTELGRPHAKIAALHQGASDAEIAEWCATNGWVVVTCDEDFRSRELRASSYLGRRVDVVLCTRQPASLREQLELLVFNYAKWVEAVESPRHPRLWLQHGSKGRLSVGRL
jgi:predicted nuclease of predicted toxin-antitoxin system